MTSAHVAILLSFMQLIEEYVLAKKKILIIPDPLDINDQLRKNKRRHVDVMNVARVLKLHDLILSFLWLSRTNIGSKTFFRSLWKVWVLCYFLNLSCLGFIATSRPNHKPQRFDFLIECKLNDGTCQFYFSHNENIQFSTFST